MPPRSPSPRRGRRSRTRAATSPHISSAPTGPLHHSDRSPLLVADELLDENWASEDQRYTAVGVLLRYEHDIVALVPDGHGGTSVEREDEDDGYRHYYAYVGDFWGPSYQERVQCAGEHHGAAG